MSGIADEVKHHDRWCYFALELKEILQSLRGVLDAFTDGVPVEETSLRSTVDYYEAMAKSLSNPGFKTIPHEIYAMYQDLLRGRTVIFNDVDALCDLTDFHDFGYAVEIAGEADVLWTDDGPRLINKRWAAPVHGFMFYDHFPCDDEEALAGLTPNQLSCKCTGWAVRLDPTILRKQRF